MGPPGSDGSRLVRAVPPCQTRQAAVEGLTAGGSLQHVDAPGELAHHPEDVPAAVAHHHVVRRVAELGAVALRLAQQPGQVQQRPRRPGPRAPRPTRPTRSRGRWSRRPRAPTRRSRRRARAGPPRWARRPSRRRASRPPPGRAGRWRPSSRRRRTPTGAARARTRGSPRPGPSTCTITSRHQTRSSEESGAGTRVAVPRSKDTREAMSGTSPRRASRARSRWRCTGSMPSTRNPKCVASRNACAPSPQPDVDDPAVGAEVELAHHLEQHRGVRAATGSRRGARRTPPRRAGSCRRRSRDPRPRQECALSRVAGMARRAFLHVGTAKSGTSYLQDLWWRHHDELRGRGLLLPGRARRDHFTAAALVKGMTSVVDALGERDRAAWDRLVEETRAWPGRRADQQRALRRHPRRASRRPRSPTSARRPTRCTSS